MSEVIGHEKDLLLCNEKKGEPAGFIQSEPEACVLLDRLAVNISFWYYLNELKF